MEKLRERYRTMSLAVMLLGLLLLVSVASTRVLLGLLDTLKASAEIPLPELPAPFFAATEFSRQALPITIPLGALLAAAGAFALAWPRPGRRVLVLAGWLTVGAMGGLAFVWWRCFEHLGAQLGGLLIHAGQAGLVLRALRHLRSDEVVGLASAGASSGPASSSGGPP